jgi:hypothetical protein
MYMFILLLLINRHLSDEMSLPWLDQGSSRSGGRACTGSATRPTPTSRPSASSARRWRRSTRTTSSPASASATVSRA